MYGLILSLFIATIFVMFNMYLTESKTIHVWKEKYSGHNFSKTDLDNSSVFNITEVDKYMCYSYYANCHLGTNLVELGVQIVKDNEKYILHLPIDLEPRNHVILIKNGNLIYTITWLTHGVFGNNICLSFNNKKYCFNDLSQVEMYFDIQKQIST